MTPVKYECVSGSLIGTVAKSKITLTEKLANGALVTPTQGQDHVNGKWQYTSAGVFESKYGWITSIVTYVNICIIARIMSYLVM